MNVIQSRKSEKMARFHFFHLFSPFFTSFQVATNSTPVCCIDLTEKKRIGEIFFTFPFHQANALAQPAFGAHSFLLVIPSGHEMLTTEV
jgi:hypothetical protein